VTPPENFPNELARCFAELERLGLVRPATVSVAEYLTQLASGKVVDSETSAIACAAFDRLRYGSAAPDNPQVRQASEGLRASIAAFAAMPDEERARTVERIRRRLAPAALRAEGSEGTDFPSYFEPRGTSTSNGVSGDQTGGIPTPHDIEPGPKPEKVANRRREIRISSVPLETATLVVVGLVVAGYILRGGTDQAISANADEAGGPGAKRAKVSAADVWRHNDYWAANLRRRAQTEAARKREKSASLGLEMLISEVPRDPGALNDLAWLYLTSDDTSLRNPQRGLDLALRALAVNRAPAILDTAAEARFQTGQPEEAAKLEREALDSLPKFSGMEDRQFLTTLQRQLEKFENAAKTNPPQNSAPAS
jgi:hypothetical protein